MRQWAVGGEQWLSPKRCTLLLEVDVSRLKWSRVSQAYVQFLPFNEPLQDYHRGDTAGCCARKSGIQIVDINW